MIILIALSCFIIGVLLGAKVYKELTENKVKEENKKIVDNVNSQYLQLLSNIVNGTTKFKSRVNSTVHIESSLSDHGSIDIIYLLDKDDIAIFQGNKCLYTSEKVDKKIVSKITFEIQTIYKKEISEVINFFGLVFSKDEFERTFRMDFNQVEKLAKNLQSSENSEIDSIVNNNQNKFDVDEILDKISLYGLEGLTPEERKFLDNYGNEKGN